MSQSPPEQMHPQQFPPQQGQFGPRFGGPPQGMQGPPGMGPRPMGPNNELWIETKTEEGKSYYYHAISRQTTWVRPTGPNVQVMTQAEVENMQKQQMQKREPAGMPPGMGMPPPNFQQPVSFFSFFPGKLKKLMKKCCFRCLLVRHHSSMDLRHSECLLQISRNP